MPYFDDRQLLRTSKACTVNDPMIHCHATSAISDSSTARSSRCCMLTGTSTPVFAAASR